MTPQTRALATGILLATALGCDGAPRPTFDTLTGTWELESVGGNPATDTARKQGGTILTLSPDSSFVITGPSRERRFGAGDTKPESYVKGRWSLDGDSVRLVTPDGGGAEGQVRGDRLRMDLTGGREDVWVYRHVRSQADRG
jgi:hypothetical protein